MIRSNLAFSRGREIGRVPQNRATVSQNSRDNALHVYRSVVGGDALSSRVVREDVATVQKRGGKFSKTQNKESKEEELKALFRGDSGIETRLIPHLGSTHNQVVQKIINIDLNCGFLKLSAGWMEG
ncbi:hypothetical protein CISG_00100 [Coccidioides immitis RMSCC 3703]|uniref:Uncharacterized protein n=1 Tax=Coccidioides immitis RMSCC 3703 TaxID=454286 RepID=A0A0J8QH83_COCIT|nr:hypothetical protein CISG_00100 [Coccidioides immitis RMSCC 3703]